MSEPTEFLLPWLKNPWEVKACSHCGQPVMLAKFPGGAKVLLDGYAFPGGDLQVQSSEAGLLIVDRMPSEQVGERRGFSRHNPACGSVK